MLGYKNDLCQFGSIQEKMKDYENKIEFFYSNMDFYF